MNQCLANRRRLSAATAMAFMVPLTACQADTNSTSTTPMTTIKQAENREYVVLNIEAFNYYDRSIHDVSLSGKGASGAMSAFGGAQGIIAGVQLPLGSQTLTWELGGPKGTHRNGETLTIKNKLAIDKASIPAGTRYLGLHIYPDETAELTFVAGLPEMTPRGQKLFEAGTSKKKTSQFHRVVNYA